MQGENLLLNFLSSLQQIKGRATLQPLLSNLHKLSLLLFGQSCNIYFVFCSVCPTPPVLLIFVVCFVFPMMCPKKLKDVQQRCTSSHDIGRLHLMGPMYFWRNSTPFFGEAALYTTKLAILEDNIKIIDETPDSARSAPHSAMRPFFVVVENCINLPFPKKKRNHYEPTLPIPSDIRTPPLSTPLMYF